MNPPAITMDGFSVTTAGSADAEGSESAIPTENSKSVATAAVAEILRFISASLFEKIACV
ncbi:MAG: hypothetical protein AAB692_06015 [Patescibacteria group bacterium]